MKGDFSRLTFDPDCRVTRVLFQQGRPQLDADLNELSEVLVEYQRQLAVDVLGPYGTRVDTDAFQVGLDVEDGELVDLTLGSGWYYVGGLRCTYRAVDGRFRHSEQPHVRRRQPLPKPPFFVYLRAWERHVTAVEDPTIREVALGPNGPDTTTRTVLLWQVVAEREISIPGFPALSPDMSREQLGKAWLDWSTAPPPAPHAEMRARVFSRRDEDEYRAGGYQGPENQLYRVEVHRGGGAAEATFSFSRDNGSVVLPVTSIADTRVGVATLGRDSLPGVGHGDWVEVVDDRLALHGRPGPLRMVRDVDPDGPAVLLTEPVGDELDGDPRHHPLLRRWDQQETSERPGGLHLGSDNAIEVVEGDDGDTWLELEDGVHIQFRPGGHYRSGDYWLVPARTVLNDILWPSDPSGAPTWLPPRATIDRYAPLARVRGLGNGELDDLRSYFGAAAFLVPG